MDPLPNMDNGSAPPLPPEEEPPMKFSDYFKVVKGSHMYALLWKNFLWMTRNFG